MLSSGARPGAARLLIKQSCLFKRRIELISGTATRVSAAYSSSALPKSLLFEQSTAIDSLCFQRSYATAGRPASKPKAHTGRGTTRKTTATKKKKTTAKKKAIARIPKPKKKARARPRKILTEEDKLKNKIKELKKAALKRPRQLPSTVFGAINTELSKENKGLSSSQAATRVKNLSPEEIEHYNHIVNENRDRNAIAYRAWIQSHTPEQIRIANNARRNLTRKGVKGYSVQLKDERIPKQPATARSLFLKDRYASGDMAGIALKDAAALITTEWNNLPETEKEKYRQMEAQDRTRYIAAVEAAFGRTPRYTQSPEPRAAAGAA